ncbi:putative mitochondrial hypothetical protein [Leptomonas pyrrhocoris]|uniref:Uncharacterized protein n=1 Tax=Leptomonas pyrrhocoris TaxID=157538 RepID=A0A0M9G3N4_LEPPY|nr:putative mitochondrial hypothetical protein [Leptomonas pyrrhocoris]KPA81499.1 putative mitochondrial hypothetical protein [Leptomonas pyrrhocoris]|eukprot:XP_015659938.1 putative mitochondrial hypothetical protein [Leptomonas pyrrhocoris]
MGGSGSKPAPTAAAATTTNSVAAPALEEAATSASKPVSRESKDFYTYKEFRDQLLDFALGESAFDYAERLFEEQPDSPEVMALLAETTVLYDKTKNKVSREHWCDRLDLLQRGVDVSRKCINENQDYGPCYRTYVMCAARESEALYYMKSLTGLGLVENYQAIMKKGKKGMALLPTDAEIPNTLGALCARCSFRWYDPSRLYAWYYGLPNTRTLREMSVRFHKKAAENDPKNLEYACRLAQAYFQLGDRVNARRWYVKVRDEMPPQELKDEKWQGVAHTQLSTAFTRPKWNVPFA